MKLLVKRLGRGWLHNEPSLQKIFKKYGEVVGQVSAFKSNAIFELNGDGARAIAELHLTELRGRQLIVQEYVEYPTVDDHVDEPYMLELGPTHPTLTKANTDTDWDHEIVASEANDTKPYEVPKLHKIADSTVERKASSEVLAATQSQTKDRATDDGIPDLLQRGTHTTPFAPADGVGRMDSVKPETEGGSSFVGAGAVDKSLELQPYVRLLTPNKNQPSLVGAALRSRPGKLSPTSSLEGHPDFAKMSIGFIPGFYVPGPVNTRRKPMKLENPGSGILLEPTIEPCTSSSIRNSKRKMSTDDHETGRSKTQADKLQAECKRECLIKLKALDKHLVDQTHLQVTSEVTQEQRRNGKPAK